jgi:DNA-cytosine methyltransferase
MNKYSFIDLFAGAGGWSLGFEAAGFFHSHMYDFNRSACETAVANFGNIVQCADLSQHADICFPDVDIVVGSPPCQGFSNEGKKNPDDPRNSLVWSYLDIIDRLKPRNWVFENVPGFQRSYGGRWFKMLSERLNQTNYKWTCGILNAADYGVPQHRKRFVIIASLDFSPILPPPTHTDSGRIFGERPYVSLWDAISDLPVAVQGDRIGEFDYGLPASCEYQKLMRFGSKKIFNHSAQKHSARVLEKITAVPMGGNMSSFIDSYEENATHYAGGYRRATKEKPSWTAYWTRGMTSIHPEQHRFLTPRECARIQSFPDRHKFMGTTIENYTQICNAVPPLLAEAIARQILRQLGETENFPKNERLASRNTSLGFSDSLGSTVA